MGIYEDRQIHTKTGFRPIKLQESRSGPHTNRTPSNKVTYCRAILWMTGEVNPWRFNKGKEDEFDWLFKQRHQSDGDFLVPT